MISREFGRSAASGPIAPARQRRSPSAWGLTPYSEGVGALWPTSTRAGGGGRAAARAMPSCCKPEGPIVFAGEHLSYQPTWQEGAALSAHEAMKVLSAMARDTGRGRAAAS